MTLRTLYHDHILLNFDLNNTQKNRSGSSLPGDKEAPICSNLIVSKITRRTVAGMENWISEQKIGNISEKVQDKDIVSIERICEVSCGLSFTISIDDLE